MTLLYDNQLHHTATVQTTASVVLAADRERHFLLIQNISDTDIFIALQGTAQLDHGIMIPSKGNMLLDDAIFASEVTAIHGGTGDKTLLITVAS